jgi:CRP-like cAMP-binding protein
MDYLSFFRQFSTLSESSYALFMDKCREKSADRGEILLKEGEVQKEMLLVLEGVQMSFYYHNDKQHIIAFSYPPSPSGVPESFFSQQPSRFCLQAMNASKFYAISYSDIQFLLENNKEWEVLFRKMTEAVLAGTIQRCVELQAYSMEERFIAFSKRSLPLFQLIPHKYLAAYLNISPTNFSKLYNRIKI